MRPRCAFDFALALLLALFVPICLHEGDVGWAVAGAVTAALNLFVGLVNLGARP